MELDIIDYKDLTRSDRQLRDALYQKGIVGIYGVPHYLTLANDFISAARAFSKLSEQTKNQYIPARDSGKTEGYELGQEKFKDDHGNWQIDHKKASYYAYIPDQSENKWPHEVNLKDPFCALGELIYQTGLKVLNSLAFDKTTHISLDALLGYGRMLHYRKENDATNANPNWCGAHYDHGVFTGLMPAYYYRDDNEIAEPDEAGLFIVPTGGTQFEKIHAYDKNVLLFQVGEFGQLASQDEIRATKHCVKKAFGSIERFTLAVFYSATNATKVRSSSVLTQDERYRANRQTDGSIYYGDWHQASFARYWAK